MSAVNKNYLIITVVLKAYTLRGNCMKVLKLYKELQRVFAVNSKLPHDHGSFDGIHSNCKIVKDIN